MKEKYVKFVAVMLVLLLPGFFGCSNNPKEPKPQQPPVVPPLSTMVMDLSAFDSQSLAKTAAKTNWLWAAGNLVVWNTALTLTLAVPVAAFGESFNHSPVLQSDGRWLWSYNVSVAALQYTSELYGKVGLDGITWDMYITLHGAYTNFHWFTGKSDLAATAGFWELNFQPIDPKPFLHIDWTRDPANQALEVTYTNIIPDNAENGSYILQALNQTPPFTGRYEIFIVSQNNKCEIMWNRETIEGRVKDPKHFSNEDWHCWDSDLNDVECPN